MTTNEIIALIGDNNQHLLTHTCNTISKDDLHLPAPNFIDNVVSLSNRNTQTLRNLSALYNHGRLSGSGYLSILPVDQGVEHSAGRVGADGCRGGKLLRLGRRGGNQQQNRDDVG